jgi:hypothetical protein
MVPPLAHADRKTDENILAIIVNQGVINGVRLIVLADEPTDAGHPGVAATAIQRVVELASSSEYEGIVE